MSETGIFHKMWRGHNGERVLESHDEKLAYLEALCSTLTEEIAECVEWYGYCVMDNHTHEPGRVASSVSDALRTFGNWMRNAHSRFGAWYNRKHERKGKVAYDRPKTCEVQEDQRAIQRVMFYADANPVSAGLVKHPSQYPYSSYNYYAHGQTNEVSKKLTEPAWYTALAKTKRGRQKRYRQLVDDYLRTTGLLDDEPRSMEARFIGDEAWVEARRRRKREKTRPPPT